MFRQILSRPPIHSATSRRYFHEITLRDNPPFHPLTRPGCRKESLGYGQKEYKGSPIKALSLHTFFMPVIISPFVWWFSGDFRVMTNTGNSPECMVVILFSILPGLYFPPHQSMCRKAVRS